MKRKKGLLLVGMIVMMGGMIVGLKVEGSSDEEISGVVFGIVWGIVSYVSRD